MLVTLLGIVIEVRLLHIPKASFPMLVTLLGMVTDVRPLQPSKALLPMLFTLLPIFTDVRPLQHSYLEVIDYQLFVVNTVEKWIGCYLWVYGK